MPEVLDELEELEDDDADDRDDDDDEELNRLVVPRLELELLGTTAGLALLPVDESPPEPEVVAELEPVDTLDELELPVGCATRLGVDIGVLAL